MGFTNVAWEARSTEQLARDLTDGPGPRTVGDAGAAWVRIANEFASVSADFDRLVERLRTAWDSAAATAATQRLEEFSRWLRAASLSAAANGQRAEEAAVANTVAIMAMPSVAEAVEAQAARDMMASLSAYNGAVLTGRFAEFDEAATADHANAAAVMTQYEEAVAHLATPWEQPPPPQVTNSDALRAETGGTEQGAGAASGGGSGGIPAAPVMPLSPAVAATVGSSADPKNLRGAGFTAGAGGAGGGSGMGGGYAPMAGAMGRADQQRDYESVQPAAQLEGAGEAGAGLSAGDSAWMPATAPNDAPFQVSSTSWGPDTSVFDDLVVPADGPGEDPPGGGFLDDPAEDSSGEWATTPVLGVDRELRL
jgi:hypothetical protein